MTTGADFDADLVLAGGGLAAGLIALRLATARPELRVVILEGGPRLGGEHTWSFFDSDVAAASLEWLRPLIAHRWAGYSVRFPALKRDLDTSYFSITAERLHATVVRKLGPAVRLNSEVVELGPDRVTLADGRTLRARGVIDARGPAASPRLALGFQKFVGVEFTTERSHGLARPIVMDATVDQHDGYRFLYTLPLGPRRLLVEDTRYSDGPELDRAALGATAAAYAAQQGWRVEQVVRSEHGVLPVALAGDIYGFWADAERESPAARVGLRAALFHPTTGYSLPDAVRLAERFARMPNLTTSALRTEVRVASIETWRARGFYRALNRMLFRAGRPEHRYRVLQRFYRLPEPLVRRFYAAELTVGDMARILAGRPPVPIREALACLPEASVLSPKAAR